MKPMEYITVRKAVLFGYLTSRKGTAVKLSLSVPQTNNETKVRNTAFIARKASLS